VSFGAVVAGALLNTMGWVSFLLLKTENLSWWVF
jgi:hypothetical protein